MTLDFTYDYFTAKELRLALAVARSKIPRENDEDRVRDKLEYLYRLLTKLAWLSQEVTEDDDFHFKKEEER